MKKPFILFLLFILSVSFAFAQEPAKYNLGSAQGAKELTVSPGNEITAKIYFYNVYGNRITHISLDITEAPGNWEIQIIPGSTTQTYDVSGVLTDVIENLSLEPNDLVDEVPEEGREGFTFLPAPNVGGYIPAKEVLVKIKVPENEELGKTFSIIVKAEGTWLGQLGTIAFKQDRTFEYTVTTLSEEFYEKKVTIEQQKEEPITETLVESTSPFVLLGTDAGGIIVLIIVIIVIVGLIIYKSKRPKSPLEGSFGS